MPEWQPKQSFVRWWAGKAFLRIVLSTRLTRFYNRTFTILGHFHPAVQVSVIRVVVGVIGRVTAPYWISEHDSKHHSHTLTMQAVGLHRGEEAVYTGRGIFVWKPLLMNELQNLGLKLGTNPEQLEFNFWRWLQDYGLEAMRRVVEEGQLDDLKNDSFRTLAHEYCHWAMTMGTNLATVVEAVSWRATLEELVLTELIIRKTGIPRYFDKRGVALLRTDLDYFKSRLVTLSSDVEVASLLEDLTNHHNHEAFRYPSILSVLLEPVAWALVPEPDMTDEELLEEYFDDPASELYRHAKEALDIVRNHFPDEKRKDPEARKRLIRAVRVALNFPLRWNKKRKKWIGPDHEGLEEVFITNLIQRFKGDLEGRDIPVARRDETHLADAIAYALWFRNSKTTGNAAIRIAVEIVKREPELFNYFLEMALWSLGAPTFSTVTVVVNALTVFDNHSGTAEATLSRLRYDEFINLARTSDGASIPAYRSSATQRPVRRIDDVVGDLPSTFPAALVLLYQLGEIIGLRAEGKTLTASRRLSKLEERGTILEAVSVEACSLYRSLILKNLPPYVHNGLNHGDLLLNKPEDHQIEKFLCFWLEFVATMGEYVTLLLAEHGMSA